MLRIEKDGICEDTVEEMRIEIGDEDESDDDDDDDVDELLDDSDRQLIDRVLEQTSTSTQTSHVCTNVRCDLTERLQDYEPHFFKSVLPLP